MTIYFYNPFPGARWLRNSLAYLADNKDPEFYDEWLYCVQKMGWEKIPYDK